MQEYLYANRVRVGPHPQQMPFAIGLINIHRGVKESKKETLGLHLLLVKRWVLDINPPPVTKIIFIIPEDWIRGHKICQMWWQEYWECAGSCSHTAVPSFEGGLTMDTLWGPAQLLYSMALEWRQEYWEKCWIVQCPGPSFEGGLTTNTLWGTVCVRGEYSSRRSGACQILKQHRIIHRPEVMTDDLPRH